MEPTRPRVVIDTSIWLLACARKTTGDQMSGVDKQLNTVSKSQNPKRYRGFLARMLVTHEVIIPTIVLAELKNILTTGITNRKEFGNLGKIVHRDNKADLEIIVNAMEGLTTNCLPTKPQIIRQGAIWERIKQMDNVGNRWEEKFEEHESRVASAAEKAKTIQNGEEPWLRAHRRLKLRQEEFEKQYTPELSKEIKDLEAEIKLTWPDLIPDYEILLVAEACQAPVASRDHDFLLMWKGSPELSQKKDIIPKVVSCIHDESSPEISVHKLANTIREKARPHKKDFPEIY